MKFYDNKGGLWDTRFEAGVQNLSDKINDWADKKFPEINGDTKIDTPDTTFTGTIYNSTSVKSDADPIIEAESVDVTTVVAEVQAVEVAEITEPSVPHKIDIDYATKTLRLLNDEGVEVATSPISGSLVGDTVDKMMMDIMYPDGKIPEGVKMDISSKGTSTILLSGIIDDPISGKEDAHG